MIFTLLELVLISVWSAEVALALDDEFTTPLQCTAYTPNSLFRGTPLNTSQIDGATATTLCNLQSSVVALVMVAILLYAAVLVVSLFRIFMKVHSPPSLINSESLTCWGDRSRGRGSRYPLLMLLRPTCTPPSHATPASCNPHMLIHTTTRPRSCASCNALPDSGVSIQSRSIPSSSSSSSSVAAAATEVDGPVCAPAALLSAASALISLSDFPCLWCPTSPISTSGVSPRAVPARRDGGKAPGRTLPSRGGDRTALLLRGGGPDLDRCGEPVRPAAAAAAAAEGAEGPEGVEVEAAVEVVGATGVASAGSSWGSSTSEYRLFPSLSEVTETRERERGGRTRRDRCRSA